MAKDYYQILGLGRNASSDDIKKAYRIYATKFHPDKHQGDVFFEERFKEITEAHEILSDPEERSRYDLTRFGRSRIIVKAKRDRQQFASSGNEGLARKRKFRIDFSHLDIYLALFYFVNLAAWVIVRKSAIDSQTSPVWGLFVCGISTLLIWFFIVGVRDLRENKFTGSRIMLVVCFVAGLALAFVTVATSLIP